MLVQHFIFNIFLSVSLIYWIIWLIFYEYYYYYHNYTKFEEIELNYILFLSYENLSIAISFLTISKSRNLFFVIILPLCNSQSLFHILVVNESILIYWGHLCTVQVRTLVSFRLTQVRAIYGPRRVSYGCLIRRVDYFYCGPAYTYRISQRPSMMTDFRIFCIIRYTV